MVPYLAPDATALGQIFWYTVEGEGKDLGELRAIQDWYVRYQLNTVPGVAEVASRRRRAEEYQIDVDPNKLRAYGITLGEVVRGRRPLATPSVGGRVIQKGNAEYLVRGVGWIENLDDIENTVVAQRERHADLRRACSPPCSSGPQFRRSVLEKDGNEVVGGVVLMRYGENPLEVTRPDQGEDHELQAGPARGRADRPVLRPHAADPRGASRPSPAR